MSDPFVVVSISAYAGSPEQIRLGGHSSIRHKKCQVWRIFTNNNGKLDELLKCFWVSARERPVTLLSLFFPMQLKASRRDYVEESNTANSCDCRQRKRI